MHDWLARLDGRLDRIESKQTDHHITLEEHIRRSLANEAAVELLKQEMAPLKHHVAMWGVGAKVLTALGALVSLGVGIWKLVGT